MHKFVMAGQSMHKMYIPIKEINIQFQDVSISTSRGKNPVKNNKPYSYSILINSYFHEKIQLKLNASWKHVMENLVYSTNIIFIKEIIMEITWCSRWTGICISCCYYHIMGEHMYEGGPKSNRNRPVAHACFLVTSCVK
jgi:hypothetical protein